MKRPVALFPNLQCIHRMQYILSVNNSADEASDLRMWDPLLPNVKEPEAQLQL